MRRFKSNEKDENYDVYRVLYELMRSVDRVTASQCKPGVEYSIYSGSMKCIEAKGVKPGNIPADKHFDKLVDKIFGPLLCPSEFFTIYRRTNTFVIGFVSIPSSLLNMDNLIKLLHLCVYDKDYQMLYKFIDRVLLRATGLRLDEWSIGSDDESYYNISYLIYNTMRYIENIYQRRSENKWHMSEFIHPHYDEVLLPEMDNILNRFNSIYKPMPIKNYDKVWPCISDRDLLLTRYVSTMDLYIHSWANNFPLIDFVRNLCDPAGMIPKTIIEISDLYEAHQMSRTTKIPQDTDITGIMACLFDYIPTSNSSKAFMSAPHIIHAAMEARNLAHRFHI